MPGAAVTATPEQWKEVSRRVQERRVALGLNQEDLKASRSVVSNLESGRQEKYARTSLAKIERALGWESGSIDRILDGGEPELVAAPRMPSNSPAVHEADQRGIEERQAVRDRALEERIAGWEAELAEIRSERERWERDLVRQLDAEREERRRLAGLVERLAQRPVDFEAWLVERMPAPVRASYWRDLSPEQRVEIRRTRTDQMAERWELAPLSEADQDAEVRDLTAEIKRRAQNGD